MNRVEGGEVKKYQQTLLTAISNELWWGGLPAHREERRRYRMWDEEDRQYARRQEEGGETMLDYS